MAKGDICKLENWSVCTRPDDPYQAPELWSTILCGNVYGHSKFPDGTFINTSIPVKSEGRIVHTNSGTQYELGTPEKEYLEWCAKNEIVLDEDNPVKVYENEIL